MPKIEVHPLCYLFALITILTGCFRSFFLFSSLLFIHELGHVFTAKYFKWNVSKIKFYPYGGSSYFNEDINRPLREELWILFMGPLTQVLYYVILSNLPFSSKTLAFLREYHYSIFIFNLLPIYPLDGGKLCNLLFCYKLSYKKSLYLTFVISFVCLNLFFLLWLSKTGAFLNLVCMFLLLISKLLGEIKKRDYYFHKFLLERYLKDYDYPRRKMISKLEEMMRDKSHFIKIDHHYYREKEVLKKKFKKDNFIY